MELEEDSKLPFLDCLLQSESDGMLTSTVYRKKPTHTDRYLKEEEKVLQSNGYDNTTIRAGSKELPSRDHTDTEQEKGLILTIPHIAGLSKKSIQRV